MRRRSKNAVFDVIFVGHLVLNYKNVILELFQVYVLMDEMKERTFGVLILAGVQVLHQIQPAFEWNVLHLVLCVLVRCVLVD